MLIDRFAIPFIAGVLAVLVFHQGAWAIFGLFGPLPSPPWQMRGLPPLGVPQVLSTAFWGGLWAILLSELRPSLEHKIGYWPLMIVVGGILTTLVALLIVGPIKGRPFAAGWSAATWTRALALNGAWGLGVGILLKLFKRA